MMILVRSIEAWKQDQESPYARKPRRIFVESNESINQFDERMKGATAIDLCSPSVVVIIISGGH
jgi:hypothetical protein